MTTRTTSASVTARADLLDDPIDATCVLGGEPRARGTTWAMSPDETTRNWVWDCTAGAFRWWFALDETVHIVEGSVTVQVDGEEPVTLRVGDSAYFPAGRWSTWTVDDYVRKHAVLRVPVPRSLSFVIHAVARRKYAAIRSHR